MGLSFVITELTAIIHERWMHWQLYNNRYKMKEEIKKKTVTDEQPLTFEVIIWLDISKIKAVIAVPKQS